MSQFILPNTYEELSELISSTDLSPEEILEIAQAHAHESMSECEVCGVEEAIETVGELLIDLQFDNLDSAAITFLFDNIYSWLVPADGGLLELLSVQLALHRLSERRLLEEAASINAVHLRENQRWGDEVSRQELTSQLLEVAIHPNSSEPLLKSWAEEIHESSELCDLITFDECDECRAMLQEVLSSAFGNPDTSNSISQPSKKVGFLSRIFGAKENQ